MWIRNGQQGGVKYRQQAPQLVHLARVASQLACQNSNFQQCCGSGMFYTGSENFSIPDLGSKSFFYPRSYIRGMKKKYWYRYITSTFFLAPYDYKSKSSKSKR
jgi:hypothetical protein